MFRSAHVIETECVRNQSISALFVPGMVLIRVWGQSPDSLTSLSLGRAACVCVPVALQWVEELEWAHVVENPTLINHGLTPTHAHTPNHTLFQPRGRCLIVTKTHTYTLSPTPDCTLNIPRHWRLIMQSKVNCMMFPTHRSCVGATDDLTDSLKWLSKP